MSTLQRFDQDGLELVIDTQTGEAFATISGYARMSGKTKQAISKRADSSVNQNTIKTAQIQTAAGFRSSTLIPESLITDWIIKDNPDLARQMLKAGVRVYLYGVAGYQVKPEPKPQPTPQTYIEALRALADAEEAKEKQRALLERQQMELESAEEDVQKLSTVVDEVFGYASIIRVAKFNNVSETRFKWRVLKAQTQALGMDIKRVPCPRFETKLLYPYEAWEIAYPDVALPEKCHWGLEDGPFPLDYPG